MSAQVSHLMSLSIASVLLLITFCSDNSTVTLNVQYKFVRVAVDLKATIAKMLGVCHTHITIPEWVLVDQGLWIMVCQIVWKATSPCTQIMQWEPAP